MNRTVTISVETWLALCKSGASPSVTIKLNGTSMSPLVRKNRDEVVIIPINRKLKIGDVVLFERSDGAYVVHRLYKISGNTVQTLGDGRCEPDMPIGIDSVYGLVNEVKRDRRTLKINSCFGRFAGRIWMFLLPLHRLACDVIQFFRRH